MAFELDHIFIWTAIAAPEAQQFIDFGILEDKPRVHPGQGTANRRFLFQNMMLELLWVHDPTEAQSPQTQPTHLWERWHHQNDSASPFGIALRPTAPHSTSHRASHRADPHHPVTPFPGWQYQPSYLPNGLSIWFGANADQLPEPLLFYLSFGHRPDAHKTPCNLDHPIGFREVTSLRIHYPEQRALSSTFSAIQNLGIGSILHSDRHYMEIGFDGETQGQSIDFSPHLPLMFNW
jgi:Glyoxalase-like domain